MMSSYPMSPDQLSKFRRTTNKGSGASSVGYSLTVICSRCGGEATRNLCQKKKVYRKGVIQYRYICRRCHEAQQVQP